MGANSKSIDELRVMGGSFNFVLSFLEILNSTETCMLSTIKVWGSVVVSSKLWVATVYKGNIIKNLIMDCQSYTKYRPNETTGGIFVSWRRKEELPTGA